VSYNLLEEPWIPVLGTDGKPCRVGIRTALTQAGTIRQIAASNPMDNVALLRFLLSVLQWCRPVTDEQERASLCTAEGVPDAWVVKQLGPPDAPNAIFDLLGDTRRFYQDQRLNCAPARRPIGDLLQEFPTDTSIAHFRHVRDMQYGLCPACCALGIVRFCAFANAYAGGSYTSAVNGPTPAYGIPQGNTLLQTLLLNWTEDLQAKRDPPWSCDAPPGEAELVVVTVFAWRSRRLWLGERGSSDERCSHCGQLARVIREMAFTGNWNAPFEARGAQKRFWDQDPHLVLEEASGKAGAVDADSDGVDSDNDRETEESTQAAGSRKRSVTTLGFPAPRSRVAAHAGFWRRALSAVLSRPGSGWHAALPVSVSVGGPAANKGLYQDAAAISLPAVAAEGSTRARDVLDLLDSARAQLAGVLRRSTPNPKRRHPNRTALLDAFSSSLEGQLREDVENWLESLPPEDLSGVGEQLTARFRPTVERVVGATTPGSPLRRGEASRRAAQALHDAVSRLTQASEAGTGAEGPGKRRRRRGKGGES
jgi:hypothetical protein